MLLLLLLFYSNLNRSLDFVFSAGGAGNGWKDTKESWVHLRSFLAADKYQYRFDMVKTVYKYMLTIPCTEIGCERAFSVMKNIKSNKRSTMNDDKLETYMVIDCCKELLLSSIIPMIIDKIGKTNKILRKKLLHE